MPTLELSIEQGKLIVGLLHAEQAQKKVEAAIKKTVDTSKAWEAESKRAAAAENKRHAEAMRMREADDAAQKRSHQERLRMYQELFAAQNRLHVSEAKHRQQSFISGGGGLSAAAVRDPWAMGMAKIGAAHAVDNLNREKAIRADIARVAEKQRAAAIRETQEALDAANGSGLDAVSVATATAAALGLATAGWGKLRQAQEAWLTESNKIKDFNLSIAGSESNAILNLTGLDNARRVQVVDRDIPAMQKRLGFGSRQNLLDAVGSTFAASQGNIDDTLSTVEAAGALARNNPSLLPLYSSLAADLRRSTGASPKEALSFGLQVNSRVDDPAKQAAILPKVIAMAAAASSTDDNKVAARSGQAMLSAMTLFTADRTGDKGSTATDKFLEYTSEFFQGRPTLDPGTPHGRMLALEKNKALREELYEHLSKKGAIEYRPAVRAIIEPGTLTNRTYHSEFERVNFGTAQYDETVRALRSTRNLQLGDISARGEANDQEANTARFALCRRRP
jgi:hypothetical protein